MAKGYIAAMIVFGLTVVGMFVGAVVLLFVGLFSGVSDTDRYGRVSLPGRTQLEFPSGEVSVFYEEADENVKVPRDGIAYVVRPEAGGPALVSKGAGSVDEEASEGALTRVSFDRLEVPEAGVYLAEAGPVKGAGPQPALTFGEPLTANVLDRVKDALWGLLGFALAAAIALATLVTSSRGRDETVTLPPPE